MGMLPMLMDPGMPEMPEDQFGQYVPPSTPGGQYSGAMDYAMKTGSAPMTTKEAGEVLAIHARLRRKTFI